MSQNHVIDPNFFDDAIEQFAFNYDWFVVNGKSVDDLGRIISSFEHKTIRGSLQPQATQYNQRVEGNYTTRDYKFYCKSLYRINIGDFIHYKDKWLHVNGYEDYDEWGVRVASLTMIQLNENRDYDEFRKYLEGEKII